MRDVCPAPCIHLCWAQSRLGLGRGAQWQGRPRTELEPSFTLVPKPSAGLAWQWGRLYPGLLGFW